MDGQTYREAFTDQTTIEIPGRRHGLGTSHLIVAVYGVAYPSLYQIQIDAVTYDVRIQFCSSVIRALERPHPWAFPCITRLRRWPGLRWIPLWLLGELALKTEVVWSPPQSGVVVLSAPTP